MALGSVVNVPIEPPGPSPGVAYRAQSPGVRSECGDPAINWGHSTCWSWGPRPEGAAGGSQITSQRVFPAVTPTLDKGKPRGLQLGAGHGPPCEQRPSGSRAGQL